MSCTPSAAAGAALQIAPHAVQAHRAQVLGRADAEHVAEAVLELARRGADVAAQLQDAGRLVGVRQHQLAGALDHVRISEERDRPFRHRDRRIRERDRSFR